jgi:hypothetical protein
MSTEPSTTTGELDPTPYIRTFAKDYAALAGKDPEQAQKKPEKKEKKIKPKKEKRKKQKKSKTAESEAPAFVVEEESKAEPLTQPEEPTQRTETLDEKIRRLAPPELASQSIPNETFALPQIAPGDIVQQQPDRADILARLKARALEEKYVAPIVAPIAEELPPPPLEVPKTQQESPFPLHTYKTDFQDHIKNEHASPFSVLAAEKDAPVQKAVPIKRNIGGFLAVALGIVLLVVGAGGVYAAYLYMSKNAPVLSIPSTPSLITPDSRIQLTGSGQQLLTALAQQAAEPLADGDVALMYVDESTTTPQGVQEEPASGGAFIAELNLAAPDILLRNIDPASMVGIVSASGETRPFFILRVDSYERTFAGMLQWEPTLYGELSELYPEYPLPVIPSQPVVISSTTTEATSTTKTAGKSIPQQKIVTSIAPNSNLPANEFVDETVESHTVRALKDNSGRTLVLYGYADKETLIIARNEAAFTLLLNKLTSGS